AKIRFVGEAVAMCLARNRAAAEDLAQAVTLDLEELPPVVDMHAARRGDAALLPEAWGDNLFLPTLTGDAAKIAAAARDAPVAVKHEYRMARQCMSPLEGKGVLAYWDDRHGQLVVVTSTQVPHIIRTGLAECLGIEQRQLRVIAPDVGGGFGYKCVLQPEE